MEFVVPVPGISLVAGSLRMHPVDYLPLPYALPIGICRHNATRFVFFSGILGYEKGCTNVFIPMFQQPRHYS